VDGAVKGGCVQSVEIVMLECSDKRNELELTTRVREHVDLPSSNYEHHLQRLYDLSAVI